MSIHGKPLSEITEADLQRLIDDKVRESQTLEFKQEAYGQADNPTREMLRDISAMANAFGGDFLIGVEEDKDGIALDLLGVANADKEADRMVSSCLSNIAERLPGLSTQPVLLANGRYVIVFRIPRSLRAPHMVTFKGLNQCWIRHDRQKSPMSIHEIKDTCLKVEGLMEKLERFLGKRKQEISEDVGTSPYFFLSITPVFLGSEIVNIRDSQLSKILTGKLGARQENSVPFGFPPEPTLHGLKAGYGTSESVEIFRNGHLELLLNTSDLFLHAPIEIDGQKLPVFEATGLIRYTLSFFQLAKALYTQLEVTDSFVVSLSLYNIEGFGLPPSVVDRSRLENASRVKRVVGFWQRKRALEIPPRQFFSLERPEDVSREVLAHIGIKMKRHERA